jgi:cysteine-rich repeat protein
MPCGAGLCDSMGKQCDVCVANSKTCDGNSVKTCNALGQGYATARCPSEKPLCTGNGNCVACEQARDCPAASECSVAMCNSASGSCAATFKAAGAACSAGLCDGRGNCGPAPKCGDGIKNQPSEDCDDGNVVQEDDCLSNCKSARCGDGVLNRLGTASTREACDLSVQGTSPWECSASCVKTSIYTGCASADDCADDAGCGPGLCTAACSNPGVVGAASGCSAPQKPGSNLKPHCTLNLVQMCVLVGCGTDSDCPDGTRCIRQDTSVDRNDPNYFNSLCANPP